MKFKLKKDIFCGETEHGGKLRGTSGAVATVVVASAYGGALLTMSTCPPSPGSHPHHHAGVQKLLRWVLISALSLPLVEGGPKRVESEREREKESHC